MHRLFLFLLLCLLANGRVPSTRSLLQEAPAADTTAEAAAEPNASSTAGEETTGATGEGEAAAEGAEGEAAAEGEAEGEATKESETTKEGEAEGKEKEEGKEENEEKKEEEEAAEHDWHLLIGRVAILLVVILKLSQTLFEYKEVLKELWGKGNRTVLVMFGFLFLAVVLELLENIYNSAETAGAPEPSETYEAVVSGLAFFASFGLCCNVTVLYLWKEFHRSCYRTIYSSNILLVVASLAILLYLGIAETSNTYITHAVFAGLMLVQAIYWVWLKGPANVNWFVVLQVFVFVAVLVVAALVNPEKEYLVKLIGTAVMNVKALTLEPLLELGLEESEDQMKEKKEEEEKEKAGEGGETEVPLKSVEAQ